MSAISNAAFGGSIRYPATSDIDHDELNMDVLFRQYQAKRLSPRSSSSTMRASLLRDKSQQLKGVSEMNRLKSAIEDNRGQRSSDIYSIVKEAATPGKDERMMSNKLTESSPFLELRKRPPPPRQYTTKYHPVWQQQQQQQQQQQEQANRHEKGSVGDELSTLASVQRQSSPEDDVSCEETCTHRLHLSGIMPLLQRPQVTRAKSCTNGAGQENDSIGDRISKIQEPERRMRRSVSVNSSTLHHCPPPSDSSAFPHDGQRLRSATSKSYFKSRTEEMPLVEVSPGTFVPL
ncbi:MAG: hypothetical protein SGILL_005054, partial [Bacillariaceae sp.]